MEDFVLLLLGSIFFLCLLSFFANPIIAFISWVKEPVIKEVQSKEVLGYGSIAAESLKPVEPLNLSLIQTII